jgi:hypothetical protein
MGEHPGDGDAVEPGHLDVQQRDVRVVLPDRGGRLIAAADRCHDFEVLLQREHDGERAADEFLVVSEQQPDQRSPPFGGRQRAAFRRLGAPVSGPWRARCGHPDQQPPAPGAQRVGVHGAPDAGRSLAQPV